MYRKTIYNGELRQFRVKILTFSNSPLHVDPYVLVVLVYYETSFVYSKQANILLNTGPPSSFSLGSDGSYYKLFTTRKLGYEDAKHVCRTLNSHLAIGNMHLG